jgi:arylsulfatase A-like enzyme
LRLQDYFSHGGDKSLDFHLEIGERCGDNCTQPQWGAIGQYSTTLFTSRAVDIVEKHDPSTPLFLYLAYQAVHGPSEVPASYKDAYKGIIKDTHRQTFAGMLSCMDEGIGNVTAAMDKRGMLEDTFLVFTTDNVRTLSRVFFSWFLAHHIVHPGWACNRHPRR